MNIPRMATTAALVSLALGAQAADTVAEMFGEGEAHIDFRYRFEYVDQDGFRDSAKASTLRTRLNFNSAELKGWQFFIEADDLREIGLDDFNNTVSSSPARTRYPVVADPEYTEINQGYIQYGHVDNRLRFGRQRINLDNQRFVGGVGWRQNEQTYDGISWQNSALADTTLFYAYVRNVNRIFGGDSPAGDHEGDTHLVNVSREIEGVGTLGGYYYAIDNDDAASFSTDTLGLRFSGQTEAGSWPVSYAVEAATQKDAGDNPVDFDENYLRLDAAISLTAVKLGLGYEVLGGDADRPGGAFRTPLATLHAFNGWADQFLTTPDAGIEDLFVTASGKLSDWAWQAVYHDFQAESRGPDYGNELDLSLARKFSPHYSLLLKFADFSGNTGRADVTKGWVMFSASF